MRLPVTEGYLQGNFHMQFKQPDKHGLLLTCHLSNGCDNLSLQSL